MVVGQTINDGGFDEVPMVERRSTQSPAAKEDPATVLLGLLDGPLIRLHGREVDHGSQPGVAVERVPNLQVLRLLDQHLDESLAHLRRDVGSGAGRALLTLCAEG